MSAYISDVATEDLGDDVSGESRQGMPLCDGSASETAGLKWAPETGPNVRISATKAAPVVIVFASKAIATFPPDKLFAHDPGTDYGHQKECGSDELRR